MNDTVLMVLGCFGSTIAIIVLFRFLPDASKVEGAAILPLRPRPVIQPFPCSCCKKTLKEIPASARLMDEGDPMDGWYFECSCRSTQFIPLRRDQLAL